MMRAVIVGLGRIGFGFETDPLRVGAVTHAGAWLRHPMTSLVAAADPVEDKRAAFNDKYDLPACESLDQLIDEFAPDFVSICTPPETHADLVLEAISRGVRRVICEKPCTQSAQSAAKLLADLGDLAVCVGVNFTRRYDPLHRYLFSQARSSPLVDGFGRYTAGLQNTASHWLDCLRAAGGEVVAVKATARVSGLDPTPDLELQLTNGATVNLHGHDVNNYLVFEMDFHTRETRIQLTDSGTAGRLFRVGQSPMYSGYSEAIPTNFQSPLGLSSPMLPVVDDAVSSQIEDHPMLCGVADALAIHKILEAAHESLSSSKWSEVS